MLDLLLTRRSVKAAALTAPAPDKTQLETLLTAAFRVPDHGKAVPFYALVFEAEAREAIGQIIAERFIALNPDAPDEKVTAERERFTRAPLVIAIIHRKRPGKHPQWEQMLTCGAVCQNLLLAAHAMGFAGQWLTEWYAYDDDIRAALGLDARDVLAGFLHIGTPPAEAPVDRDRPAIDHITTRWQPGAELNKGDALDRTKLDFPRLGF